MKDLLVLWRFSRPHTIVGSSISVGCLFVYAWLSYRRDLMLPDLVFGALSLFVALACNLFITGINQIYDVDIDKINKPNLPIVTGELSAANAKKIVLLSLISSLSVAFYLSTYYGGLIALIAILGWAYSAPPIRFKRYHFWAASAIALVRGPLVNIGIALHFLFYFTKTTPSMEGAKDLVFFFRYGVWMIPLTVFITAFSLGIAWFKDLPDVEGDKNHQIGTLAVKIGQSTAFILGATVVSLGYGFMIWWGYYFGFGLAYVAYHIVALLVFGGLLFQVKLNQTLSLKRFYMSYWILFFLEYFSFFLLYLK